MNRRHLHAQRSLVSLDEGSDEEPLSSGDDWDHAMEVVPSRDENVSPNHKSGQAHFRKSTNKPTEREQEITRYSRSRRDPEESQHFRELQDDSYDDPSEEYSENEEEEEEDDDDATSALMEASAAVFHYLTTTDAESGCTMSDDVSIADRSAAVFDYLKQEATYGNEKPMRQFLETAQVVSDVMLKKQYNRPPPPGRYNEKRQKGTSKAPQLVEDDDEISLSQQRSAIFQALEHAIEEHDDDCNDNSRHSPTMLQWLETKPDQDMQSVVSEMSTTIFKVLDDATQKVDEESVAEFSEAVAKLLEDDPKSARNRRKNTDYRHDDDDTCSISERSAAIFKVLDRTAAPDVNIPTRKAKSTTSLIKIPSPSMAPSSKVTVPDTNVLRKPDTRANQGSSMQPLPMVAHPSPSKIRSNSIAKNSETRHGQTKSLSSTQPRPASSITGDRSLISHLAPRTDPSKLMQRNIFHILAQRGHSNIPTIEEVEDEEIDDDDAKEKVRVNATEKEYNREKHAPEKEDNREKHAPEEGLVVVEDHRPLKDNIEAKQTLLNSAHTGKCESPKKSNESPKISNEVVSDDQSSNAEAMEPKNVFSEVIHADSSDQEIQEEEEMNQDIDLDFVERFDHAFNAFIGLHPKFLLNNPTLVHHLRITKLQKLLKHIDVYHSSLLTRMETVKNEKQIMENDFQSELKDASRQKAAYQIKLQSMLTSLSQKVDFKKAQIIWKIVSSSEARVKQEYIFRQRQKKKREDFVQGNLSGVLRRDEILELLPNDEQGTKLKEAIFAEPRFFSKGSQELELLRQYQVDNAFMSSEIVVLKKRMSHLQATSKRLAWIDSILLRMDKVQMAKLKNKYTNKLGVVSLE